MAGVAKRLVSPTETWAPECLVGTDEAVVEAGNVAVERGG
jgi:hypothetical protein